MNLSVCFHPSLLATPPTPLITKTQILQKLVKFNSFLCLCQNTIIVYLNCKWFLCLCLSQYYHGNKFQHLKTYYLHWDLWTFDLWGDVFCLKAAKGNKCPHLRNSWYTSVYLKLYFEIGNVSIHFKVILN